ncbi:hypothetical protein [Photobacterium phosphoreum]|uniref:hypothetical protein n=1 Tax=Photobacterium phosphoreum TaxID=659 RepID=UPI00242F4599|nr:hypothetical protein [Photobacterium phosphoreum]
MNNNIEKTNIYASQTVKSVRQVSSQLYLESVSVKKINDAAQRLKEKAYRIQTELITQTLNQK